MSTRPLTDAAAKRLGSPRYRVEIPDQGADYLTQNCERRLANGRANKITDRMPVVQVVTFTIPPGACITAKVTNRGTGYASGGCMVGSMSPIIERPSLLRRALTLAADLLAVARALGRDCHPGESIISRQPADERRRLDAVNGMLP